MPAPPVPAPPVPAPPALLLVVIPPEPPLAPVLVPDVVVVVVVVAAVPNDVEFDSSLLQPPQAPAPVNRTVTEIVARSNRLIISPRQLLFEPPS